MVWQYLAPALGSLAGGALGGIFGQGKRTGTGRASVQAFDIFRRGLGQAEENFARFAPMMFHTARQVSPVFGALESSVLGDLNDEQRTARLERAFADRLNQQQAAQGVLGSGTSALRTSFAGLQFGEQVRQQAFGNALGFQQAVGNPLLQYALSATNPQINAQEFGLQGLALRAGAQSSLNQSIYGGIQQGFGLSLLQQGGWFDRPKSK